MELILFGEEITKINLEQSIFILDEKNYEKTEKQFQKEFIKVKGGNLYIKRNSNTLESDFIKFHYGHKTPKIKLCSDNIANVKRPDDGTVFKEYYTNQSMLDEMRTSGIYLEKDREYAADDFDLIVLPGTDNLTVIDLNEQKKIQELKPNESLIIGRMGDISFGNPTIERVVSGEHLIVRKDESGKIYIKDISRNGTRAIKKGFSIGNGNNIEYSFRKQA